MRSLPRLSFAFPLRLLGANRPVPKVNIAGMPHYAFIRRMLRSGRQHVLFLLALAPMVVGAPSMAQGGHLRHHGDKSSGRTDQERDQQHGKPTAFVASIDGIIRACAEQAAALQKLPPETIVQAVQLNDDQRAAFEQVQTSAGSVAEATNCPKRIPGELSAKLDT